MNKKSKKLTLSTETLRNLNERSLKEAQGMGTTTEVTAVCTMCTLRCGGSVCCP
ncbi:MAG TPA: hypothetical protein VE075_00015 [Thermoanaerobaculia bacterium]|nr:hypothetical protein [Thermoanaerobaculia bacterium]